MILNSFEIYPGSHKAKSGKSILTASYIVLLGPTPLYAQCIVFMLFTANSILSPGGSRRLQK